METPRIHDRGRGPEIVGTRITVYDVMDYYIEGWDAGRIANWLSQRTEDIQAAVNYILTHRAEVDAEYRKIVEQAERGNSPEVRARIEARRPFVEAKKAEILQRARESRRIQQNTNGLAQ